MTLLLTFINNDTSDKWVARFIRSLKAKDSNEIVAKKLKKNKNVGFCFDTAMLPISVDLNIGAILDMLS